jgi:hypothetical protein
MRVPTWCPFGLQAYFNGHNLLAAKLRKTGIEYRILDNAFTHIAIGRPLRNLRMSPIRVFTRSWTAMRRCSAL